MNLSGLVGYTGGHVLGNFSVTKQRGEVGTGFSAKFKDLQCIEDYKVVVESGGRLSNGGYAARPVAEPAKVNDRSRCIAAIPSRKENGGSAGGSRPLEAVLAAHRYAPSGVSSGRVAGASGSAAVSSPRTSGR